MPITSPSPLSLLPLLFLSFVSGNKTKTLASPALHHSVSPVSKFLKLLSLYCCSCFLGVASTTFTVTNNCAYTVWPGILASGGSSPLSSTGFALSPGESHSLEAPSSPWSGRLWARTLCSADPSSGHFSCATGDCGSGTVECSGSGAAPPATLAEFTLCGAGGLDFFDVSLVDGYNLPILVAPQTSGSTAGKCGPTGCLVDLNGLCPSDLKVTVNGEGVACRSACEAFGSPRYCCSGDFGSPSTCGPTSYSQFFKNACPRAYSYAYDDATSTFTCATATTPGYIITFCPSTTSLKSAGNPAAAGVPLINDTMLFMGGAKVVSHAAPTATCPPSFSLLVLVLCWPLLRLI
uniref:Thaumatin-like protein 1b isoform X1 n=1 Tax=Elaeis guineensis var. tenera TaxID=51953 RepID=A0A6J0PPM2_ELAGV|nr:thaumatin-like protein 1b isoform X1 [Elaeis guineensis]